MYPTQQAAYNEITTKHNHQRQHYQYHAASKTKGNTFFFIGNQKLLVHSMHSRHKRRQFTTTIKASAASTMHHLSSIRFDSALLPTSGHTVHWIDNVLVSFLGKPNQQPITILDQSPSSIAPVLLSSLSPSHRYAHTTTLIKSQQNITQIFLIGGSTILNDAPQSDIWLLDWQSKVWTLLAQRINPFEQGIMGHVSLAISRPQSTNILTCFGGDHRQHALYQHCTLFDTNNFTWKRLEYTTIPAPRLYPSMTTINETHALLYGGFSENSTLLGDLWYVHLNEFTDNKITFTAFGHSTPRAGHVVLMLTQSLMFVNGGNHSASPEYNTEIIDLGTILENEQTGSSIDTNYRQGHQKRRLEYAAHGTDDYEPPSGIGGGAIGGIVVAVAFVIGAVILMFVFYQQRQRRQRNYDLHSRAIRFSLSTPSQHDESFIDRGSIQTPIPAKTRLSLMSLDSDFGLRIRTEESRSRTSSLPTRTGRLSSLPPVKLDQGNKWHSTILDSPSRQLYTNWVCETPVPPASTASKHIITTSTSYNNVTSVDPRHTSIYINQSTSPNAIDHDHDEDGEEDNGGKKRSSTAFQRLRLSIFKPLDIGTPIFEYHTQSSSSSPQNKATALSRPTSSAIQMDDPNLANTKRRSSMFGLSRFLFSIGESHCDPPNGSEQQQQHQQPPPPPPIQSDTRASLGSRSVASIQWVEFNTDMDFESMHSRHLAVMNHRQSITTLSNSSRFGPTSVDEISIASRPTSPRNTLLLAPPPSFRSNHRELRSWDEARLSWLGASSSSRRLAPRDYAKTNSFPNLAPINGLD